MTHDETNLLPSSSLFLVSSADAASSIGAASFGTAFKVSKASTTEFPAHQSVSYVVLQFRSGVYIRRRYW
ncbi:hypothetical protein L1887_18136 [Cichorium endivia]|nr:hypothetical protein L1887_18131 [Cichorium endivia]KAI3510995.1 hypothetical protein L1887_18136 [Cichorium endivia]